VSDVLRGTIFGKRVGKAASDDAEHFIRCPTAAAGSIAVISAKVFEHDGPLPHPPQDQPQ